MNVDYKTYSFEYKYGGKKWNLDVVAQNEQDAKRRIEALALEHKSLGELMVSIPVPMGENAHGLWIFIKRFLKVVVGKA